MGYRTPFRFAQQSSGSSLPIVIEICKQNNWSINTKICKQKSGRVKMKNGKQINETEKRNTDNKSNLIYPHFLTLVA